MVLKYYFDLMSQPSRAVYIFLKMNNIPFEPKPIALRKREHYSEEYKKINPFSLVPVIDDDGFILTESVAILKYLSLKRNVPDNWYRRTCLQSQARVDEYMNWHHLNPRLNGSMVFQHLVIIPRAMNQPIDWGKVNRFKGRMEKVIVGMEKYFLKDDKPYLGGNDISVADLLGVCELMQLYSCCEENLYTSNPVVNAWVERVKTRIHPHFEDSHKIIFGVRDLFSKQNQQNSKM